MVRIKDKKAKGDDAFKARKQKVGRKKLAPATATKAEIHARTIRIAKPREDVITPEIIAAAKDKRELISKHAPTAAAVAGWERYRPDRTLHDNIVGATHYREATRSSSFTGLLMTVDHFAKEISPSQHMQMLNVCLSGLTDTALEVRDKALGLFRKLLRILPPPMAPEGVRHVMTFLRIALTHAAIPVRRTGMQALGAFVREWPGAIRNAYAVQTAATAAQSAADLGGACQFVSSDEIPPAYASSSATEEQRPMSFDLEQVVEWATVVATGAAVAKHHVLMPIVADLLEECLPYRNVVSSSSDAAALPPSFVERYFARFAAKFGMQWKELMELQLRMFRDAFVVERVIAVGRCFAAVGAYLHQHSRLFLSRSRHAAAAAAAAAAASSSGFGSSYGATQYNDARRQFRELFLHKVPFSLREVLAPRHSEAAAGDVPKKAEVKKQRGPVDRNVLTGKAANKTKIPNQLVLPTKKGASDIASASVFDAVTNAPSNARVRIAEIIAWCLLPLAADKAAAAAQKRPREPVDGEEAAEITPAEVGAPDMDADGRLYAAENDRDGDGDRFAAEARRVLSAVVEAPAMPVAVSVALVRRLLLLNQLLAPTTGLAAARVLLERQQRLLAAVGDGGESGLSAAQETQLGRDVGVLASVVFTAAERAPTAEARLVELLTVTVPRAVFGLRALLRPPQGTQVTERQAVIYGERRAVVAATVADIARAYRRLIGGRHPALDGTSGGASTLAKAGRAMSAWVGIGPMQGPLALLAAPADSSLSGAGGISLGATAVGAAVMTDSAADEGRALDEAAAMFAALVPRAACDAAALQFAAPRLCGHDHHAKEASASSFSTGAVLQALLTA